MKGQNLFRGNKINECILVRVSITFDNPSITLKQIWQYNSIADLGFLLISIWELEIVVLLWLY